MKKGISLIVLVITIIVMIIIAGAIIISLNSSNVISQANDAVTKSDKANLRSELSLVYADIMSENNDGDATNYDQAAAIDMYEEVTAKYTHLGTFTVSTISTTDLRPSIVLTVGTATEQI